MKIKLNGWDLATALLTLICSIPYVSSGPTDPTTPTTVKESIPPLISPGAVESVLATTDRMSPTSPAILNPVPDGNPNGAQVRVKFKLIGSGDKFSCDRTRVEIKIVGTRYRSLAPVAGGLVGTNDDHPDDYTNLATYTHRGLLASNTADDCLYNFTLRSELIGKKAFVNVSSPGLPLGSKYDFRGDTVLESITSLRQTFSIETKPFYEPN
jgi:hypothetical protein